MSKLYYAQLIFGLSFHVLGKEFKRDEKVVVTEDEATGLKGLVEVTADISAGGTRRIIEIPRFKILDDEVSAEDVADAVVDALKDVPDVKRGRKSAADRAAALSALASGNQDSDSESDPVT